MNMVIKYPTTEELMFTTLLVQFVERVGLGGERNDAFMWLMRVWYTVIIVDGLANPIGG